MQNTNIKILIKIIKKFYLFFIDKKEKLFIIFIDTQNLRKKYKYTILNNKNYE